MILESWLWRNTPPMQIARAIVDIASERNAATFVLLDMGRIRCASELDVATWLFTVGPRSSVSETLALLSEGTALEARDQMSGIRHKRHPDGPIHTRIATLLETGDLCANEIVDTLRLSDESVRATLTKMQQQGAIVLTDDRVSYRGGRLNRLYRLVGRKAA